MRGKCSIVHISRYFIGILKYGHRKIKNSLSSNRVVQFVFKLLEQCSTSVVEKSYN